MLTGLAAAVAFRAHFYNIGAEGQLYVGALAAVAIAGGAIAAPPAVLFPLMIAGGMAAGALLLLIPALAKEGVLATGLYRLRFVTHLDVDAAGVDRAVAAIRRFFKA